MKRSKIGSAQPVHIGTATVTGNTNIISYLSNTYDVHFAFISMLLKDNFCHIKCRVPLRKHLLWTLNEYATLLLLLKSLFRVN